MEHFNQVIRLLLKNAAWLLLLPIVSMATLWYLTIDQPKKYEVKSKFLYDFGGESTNVSGESLSLQEIYTEFLNTLEIIKSRKLTEKLKAQVALESITDSSTIFSYDWSEENKAAIIEILQSILDDQRTPYLNQTVVEQEILTFYETHSLSSEAIMQAISARRVQSSNFLEIILTYRSAEEVYYLSSILNSLLTKEMENISKRNIGKQKAVIEELVEKAKKELDEKVQELEDLKVRNNIINLDEHTKAIVTYQVNLEQLRAKIRQEIASTKKAKETLKSGLDENRFAAVNQDLNQDLLKKKEGVYAGQDLKLNHLKRDIDYNELIEQQKEVYRNYLTVKESLEELSKNAVYDPSMVHTGMTVKYIDFTVNADRLEDELKVVEEEIKRVRQYAAYFAPFESAISTLRDEISTAQKSYLLFLNKLNMTESLEVGASRSKLELVDHPEFPIEPLPSKTKLIIAAGGVVVFILLTAFIIINYLIDNRIKDVATFERRIGKPVIAAIPQQKTELDDPILTEAIAMITHEGIKKIARSMGSDQVIAINSLGIKDKADDIVEKLAHYWKDEKVHIVQLEDLAGNIQTEISNLRETFDRVICLSKPLQFSGDGVTIAEHADSSFLVFNLGRIKSAADDRVIRDYTNAVGNHKGFILGELLPEYMDTYIGEVPKQRNKIRKLVKKLINRDFSWN